MHSSFKTIDDFKGISLFYNEDNLIEVINNISSNKLLLKELKENYKFMLKFDFEVQRRSFMQIIES
jgi:sulfur relay (sulfurtransferase) DsrF/TusC family protein